MGAVMLGNGDGTFQKPVMMPFIGDPESIVIRDFNGDGRMDLAFANDDAPDAEVTVMLGNGDGTFQPVMNFDTGATSPSRSRWATSTATASSTWPSPTS